MTKLKVGSKVRKITGYKCNGEILSIFKTKGGEIKVVVEFDLIPGLLHIFSPEQLEKS